MILSPLKENFRLLLLVSIPEHISNTRFALLHPEICGEDSIDLKLGSFISLRL